MTPECFEVPVEGGRLAVARFGGDGAPVLGIHGITGNCMQLAPVAHRLPAPVALVAPDLRGRGASSALPGPFGMAAHAADCAAVLDQVASGPVVVLGQSMGAYVAVLLAARYPQLVDRLVLADGGIPQPLPPGMEADTVLDVVLGPALARLSQRFSSPDEYLAFWRAHPALAEDWNEDVEAYLDYDLESVEGGFRARASVEAVREDGRQVLDAALFDAALRALRCPVVLLRAPRNLVNQPTALLPDEAVAPWRERLPDFADTMVEDVNHYTLMFGARGAELQAQVVLGGAVPSG